MAASVETSTAPMGGRSFVERCTAVATDELLSFRRRVHGADTVFGDPRYFDWTYQQGPRDDGGDLTCWVCRREGRIVGQIGATRVALKVGSGVFEAAWVLDGATDPEARGQGVFSALLAAATDKRNAVMATETAGAGKRAMLSAGWSELGTLHMFVRPLDIAALLRARGLGLLAGGVGAMASAALRAVERVRRTRLSLQAVPRFDARVDEAWARASPFYPVVCRRDRAFLEWRFGRYPADRYRCFYLQRGPDTLGHAVVRFGSRGRLSTAYLVDFLCPPRCLPDLLVGFLDLARRAGMALACCLHRNPVSTSAFTMLGFLRRDTGWPLLANIGALPREEQSVAGRAENWFVTAADSDLDRPRAEEERA